MSASNKTITIRQGCRYAWREWNIFWKLSPKFFYATFASAALTALSPYATVWLSAQLVGELSGGRDPHRLMVWVLWTLGTTAVLTLLRTAAFHWKGAETDDLWQRQTRTYMDKQMSLDYVDEDSQRVYDMYSQIQQDARLSGAGGTICILLVEKIATALFQILGGVVLCWGLFTAAVPDGRLAFLGHPLFLAAFLGRDGLHRLPVARVRGAGGQIYAAAAGVREAGQPDVPCPAHPAGRAEERSRPADV